MRHDTALAIFAKFPKAGQVKTRMTRDEIPGWGFVSLEQAAYLYEAFLKDYALRFSREELPVDAFFCVRTGTPLELFSSKICQEGRVGVVEEPRWQGSSAQSIGEAMSFAIKHFLANGYRKVMILGSDLPHLPNKTLSEAQALLDAHPLVLGSDGGGCYLVGASSPCQILEDKRMVWSQGRDFQQLCSLQRELGLTVGVLPDVWADIDRAEDLSHFCESMKTDPALKNLVPHTASVLTSFGLL